VDKAIGAALMGGADFGCSVLATSGRISSDMVLKASRAGVPVVLSPRSVTTMAADLADRADIVIVGRLSKPDRLITGNKKRITGV
jgi:FdhD protein